MSTAGVRTLIIDNYDSFTFNLFHLIGEVNGEEPLVIRNDELTWREAADLSFDSIVISPGPGRADRREDFGICGEAIRCANVPVLGVCLGHQGIALSYGGAVQPAAEPFHGRASSIRHDNFELFAGIPEHFSAVRYHSLTVVPELPACLRADAWTEDGALMALAHRELPRYGVQFHPESVCSEYGERLLENFRNLTPRRTQIGFATAAKAWAAARSTETSPYRVHSRKIAFDASLAPSVFRRLYGDDTHAFWLDSSRVEPGLSRFSFMGGSGGPLGALVTYDRAAGEVTVSRSDIRQSFKRDLFEWLSEELANRRCAADELPFDFNCGFAGYFGYELGAPSTHRSDQPDAAFLFADRIVALDHEQDEAWLVSYGESSGAARWIGETAGILESLAPSQTARGPAPRTIGLKLSRSRTQYLDNVARCQKLIREGESYEVCLTNRIAAPAVSDPLRLYLILREINPAPYGAYFRFGGTAVMSCSPERFLRIDRNGTVESKPIKGTRPRGETQEADQKLRNELAGSEKERAENLMIVDLLRNDLGRVCETGSVCVTNLMDVETYETVHQLVSTVAGSMRRGVDAPMCVRAAFPGGSMTGAPKLRTVRIIDGLETCARGIYSGSLGFLALNGTADLSIVIRTLVSTPNATTLGTGGAITALSDPEAEFEETLLKARAPIQALLMDATGSTSPAELDAVLAELRERGEAVR